MRARHRIKGLKLTRVDFVPQGANQLADVLLTKSATIPIVKVANEEQRIAVAWASVAAVDGTDLVDLQGDSIGIDVLEKAVHEFALEGGGVGLNHDGGPLRGRIVESFVTSAEKQAALGLSGIPEGWIVAVKVDDEAVWQQVKQGRLKMLSIEGRADVEPIEKHRVTVTVTTEDDEPAPAGVPASQNRIGPLLELSGSEDPAAVLGLAKADQEWLEAFKAREAVPSHLRGEYDTDQAKAKLADLQRQLVTAGPLRKSTAVPAGVDPNMWVVVNARAVDCGLELSEAQLRSIYDAALNSSRPGTVEAVDHVLRRRFGVEPGNAR